MEFDQRCVWEFLLPAGDERIAGQRLALPTKNQHSRFVTQGLRDPTLEFGQPRVGIKYLLGKDSYTGSGLGVGTTSR